MSDLLIDFETADIFEQMSLNEFKRWLTIGFDMGLTVPEYNQCLDSTLEDLIRLEMYEKCRILTEFKNKLNETEV